MNLPIDLALSDILKWLYILSTRDQDIVKKRIGIGCNPMYIKDIAKEYKLSTGRVWQLQCRSLRKIRNTIKEEEVDAPPSL